MRLVFADALYWTGLANPHDQWHARAHAAGQAIRGAWS